MWKMDAQADIIVQHQDQNNSTPASKVQLANAVAA
jgi:hypothetical protein